jgi:hypothetical protein
MKEIALVAAGHDAVDQFPSNIPRVCLHCSHALGRESLLHEGSHTRVLGRVFTQQRVDFRLFLRSGHRLAVLELRRERPEIAENGITIGPAQEPEIAKWFHAADRSLGAQLGQNPVALNGEVWLAKVENG